MKDSSSFQVVKGESGKSAFIAESKFFAGKFQTLVVTLIPASQLAAIFGKDNVFFMEIFSKYDLDIVSDIPQMSRFDTIVFYLNIEEEFEDEIIELIKENFSNKFIFLTIQTDSEVLEVRDEILGTRKSIQEATTEE